jgi:lysozyme family protein
LEDVYVTVDLSQFKAANLVRWNAASVLPSLVHCVDVASRRLVAAKPRYQAVAAKTGVPWAAIAVIHERESAQDWTGSLAQGDPWNRVSVRVPAGRGPFKSWEEAAIDALVNCAPYAARNRDWSIGGTLTKLEEYNGLGYASRGVPSPYLWSGTNQYRSGKYLRDRVYDRDAVDSQPGCAGLVLAMMVLDPTITFTGVTITPAKPAPTPVNPGQPNIAKPSIANPSKGSIGAFVAAVLSAIFDFRKK